MQNENVIEMRDITKIFGTYKANDNINFNLKKGEVHETFSPIYPKCYYFVIMQKLQVRDFIFFTSLSLQNLVCVFHLQHISIQMLNFYQKYFTCM